MLAYRRDGTMGKIINRDSVPFATSGKQTVGWLTYDALAGNVSDEIIQRLKEGADQEDNWASYDCYDEYDIFYFAIPEELKDKASMPQLGACVSKDEVLIVYAHWHDRPVDFVPTILKNAIAKKSSAQRGLLAVVDILTRNDGLFLAKIEDEITTLEERIMASSDFELKGLNDEISELRRRLQPMQQTYEQLMDALEDLMEDENDVYDVADTKYATRIHNRAERLYKTVINLRDYVSQVREAYQTQVDNSLNSVMKVFTVITAIFLPLTLLVGWYGMNFDAIEEFKWQYGYVYVIVLSVVIAGFCLAWFKHKKWF
jgi:magnesium transporter